MPPGAGSDVSVFMRQRGAMGAVHRLRAGVKGVPRARRSAPTWPRSATRKASVSGASTVRCSVGSPTPTADTAGAAGLDAAEVTAWFTRQYGSRRGVEHRRCDLGGDLGDRVFLGGEACQVRQDPAVLLH